MGFIFIWGLTERNYKLRETTERSRRRGFYSNVGSEVRSAKLPFASSKTNPAANLSDRILAESQSLGGCGSRVVPALLRLIALGPDIYRLFLPAPDVLGLRHELGEYFQK